MNKKKSLYTVLSLLLVLAFILSGCGAATTAAPAEEPAVVETTEKPEPAPTDTPEPVEEPEVTEEPEETEPPVPTEEVLAEPETPAWKERPEITSDYQGELVLWDWSFEPRNKWMEQYIAEWQELHPGVTIKYEVMPESDVGSKLTTAVVAGTGPDFSVLNQEWRVEFQRNGQLEALPKDIFPVEWRDLLFTTPYLTADDGEIYVTSLGAMGAGLYWDKKIFSAAGLSEANVPKTWDETVTLAQSLTTWNDDGTLNQAGFGVNGLPVWLWFDLVVQKGGHFYNEDVTKTLWNEPAGVEAAQFVRDLFLEYKVTSELVPWWGELYCNGRAAMGYGYAWMPGWVTSNCPDKSVDLGIAPLPVFDGAPAQGIQLEEDFIGVFKSDDPAKLALIWDFIHFLLLEDDDRLVELAIDFGVPPDRKDLAADPRVQESPLLKIGSDVASTSVLPGPLPMFGDHYVFINTAFEEILLQAADVQEAIDRAVEQANLDLEASGKTYSTTEYKYVPPE
jgi:multiple sugar transport system substrate-binding protein